MTISEKGETDKLNNRQELVDAILNQQKTIFQVMGGGASPEWLEIDLTMPQLKIMFLLNAHFKMRMGELAEVLDKNLSTTTGVVDRLVEHGLVAREEHPDDRRVVIAKITERGKRLCDSLLQISQEEALEVLDSLNLEELQIVYQGMETFFRAAVSKFTEKARARGKNFCGNPE